jgi:uncharacterized Zn finger protein
MGTLADDCEHCAERTTHRIEERDGETVVVCIRCGTETPALIVCD